MSSTYGENITRLCKIRDKLTGTDKKALTWSIEQIREQPPVWISVDDRLPEPFASVLVYMPMENPFQRVHEGFITPAGVWHAHLFDRYTGEVTHWMPLQEPQEE